MRDFGITRAETDARQKLDSLQRTFCKCDPTKDTPDTVL